MRPLSILLPLLLAGTAALAQQPAAPSRPPARPPAAAAPPGPAVPAAPPAAAGLAPTPATPATPSAPAAIANPGTAPAAPSLPPPTAVPTRPAAAPGPVAIAPDAPGAATRSADGLRVTFGPGRADLAPATANAIRDLGRAERAGTNQFTVVALAAAAGDDPSTPRRLALARGLAIRSLLITEGIASTRITVRALGANPEAQAGGPPDRVDIAVAANPVTPARAP